jgi:AraC-like DNA-binding protein
VPHRRWAGDGKESWTEQDGAWIVGLHDRPQRQQAVGERDFMIVRFTPFGAHRFLRTRMDEIHGRTLALDAVDAKLAALISRRVAATQIWADRFDAMEALIAERTEQALIPDSLSFAWRRLEASDGRFPLGRLAAELNQSHRAMIAQFRTHLGVTPKVLSRVFRFARAVRSITPAGSPPLGKPYIELQAAPRAEAAEVRWADLADLAADCGYFDQSHLIKEFRQFAGTTPADFLRRMADVD